MKIAIIGCGRISYRHIQAAADNKDIVQIVALCDIVDQRASQKSEEYIQLMGVGCIPPKVYVDYKQMLQEIPEIEIVAICTESGYHPSIAIYCMSKGKHVIVEKPMALSTDDADRMIEAAQQNDVKLCVSFQNRFNPPIQKLREAVEKGRFGRIIAGTAKILWNREQGYYAQAPWRGTYDLDGGCLMNQCIHNIDLLQWILSFQKGKEESRIRWVNGDVTNYMHPYIEAEDYGSLQIKFENGAVGNVEGTVCIYPNNLEETLTIIGEKGVVVIGGVAVNHIMTWKFEDGMDDEQSVIKAFSGEVENVYGYGHTALYRDLVESISHERKPYVDGSDGKKAMEIILASYLSSMEGRRIEYPLPSVSSLDFK